MTQNTRFAILMAVVAGGLHAQTVDNSGNSMLKGGFHFRQVAPLGYNNRGFVIQIRASFGTITFDGAGNYTATGSFVDNTVSGGAPQVLSVNGTYAIGANGTGYIANPVAPLNPSDRIQGAIAQGVFCGSTTEELDGYLNDLFVAIPAGTPPTNASFTGSYWAGVLDFTGASDAALKNAMFQLNPNGQGGLGNVTATGQDYASNAPSITQTVTGGTYNFAGDGTATLTLPLPSGVSAAAALFAGTKTMFVSADGNFILGWSPGGYDMFVGVRAMGTPATDKTFQGLYYTAGLEDNSYCGVDSYSGSIWSAVGDGNHIIAQRENQPLCNFFAFDYVFDDYTQLDSNGTTSKPDVANRYTYAFGANGKAFVAVGFGGFYTLTVGLRSSDFTGSGVYLLPYGVFNAASYAPISAPLAPGELISLYGSGLAATTVSAPGGQPFPLSLGNVQVSINAIPCPIYFISPGQINVTVPYGVDIAFPVRIQVTNNGTKSNTVAVSLGRYSPGIFAQNQAGYGLASAIHTSDGSLVTLANPAKSGEYISLFLTGLGNVTPPIQDGAPGPANPLSNADVNVSGELLVHFVSFVTGVSKLATIQYAGLAPGLAGLYQLNVQVPDQLGTGNFYLDIIVANHGNIARILSHVVQVQVPVGSGGAGFGNRAEGVTSRRQGAGNVLRDDR